MILRLAPLLIGLIAGALNTIAAVAYCVLDW